MIRNDIKIADGQIEFRSVNLDDNWISLGDLRTVIADLPDEAILAYGGCGSHRALILNIDGKSPHETKGHEGL